MEWEYEDDKDKNVGCTLKHSLKGLRFKNRQLRKDTITAEYRFIIDDSIQTGA